MGSEISKEVGNLQVAEEVKNVMAGKFGLHWDIGVL